MKRLVILLAVLSVGAALDDAIATCRGDRIADIRAALENKFVCAAKTSGADTWSEIHGTVSGGTGTLTEYAKGPTNAIDPSKVVGTWSVIANGTPGATVQYVYTGDASSPYTWSLFQIPNTNSYLFCQADGSSAIATAKITDLPVNPSIPCPARQ